MVQKDYRSHGTIEAFPGELRQVVANLINNGLEAAGNAGIIRLRVVDSRDWSKPERRGLRVLIADNGPGIPPEVRRGVFRCTRPFPEPIPPRPLAIVRPSA